MSITVKAPLDKHLATHIFIEAQYRTLEAAARLSTVDDAARDGECRRWVTRLLSGEEVTFEAGDLRAIHGYPDPAVPEEATKP